MSSALWKRRLHAMSGAVALGSFLVLHLLTQASALFGAAAEDAVAGAIQRTAVLRLVEALLVYVPLGYHAGYGIWLTWKRAPSVVVAPELHERLRLLQRISAMVALAFVAVHFWEFRAQSWLFGVRSDAFYTKLAEHLSWTWAGVPWIALGYLAGLAATVFHFAYGLVTVAVGFGVATTPNAVKRVGWTAGALGIALFLTGSATIVGVATGTSLLSTPDTGKSGSCGRASTANSIR